MAGTDRIGDYAKFWDEDGEHEDEAWGACADDYTESLNGYYGGATVVRNLSWAQSFHFSRFNKGEALSTSLARHEHFLALKMGLKSGMRVLDVGCGVGGPARQIARFCDVNIVGLSNNTSQLRRAAKCVEDSGLQDRIQFVRGDIMKLVRQFGANSFDAVYAIETTFRAPSLEGVYREIFNVLKPGGVFGVYEWCMTNDWDPSIPDHRALVHEIESGSGIRGVRPASHTREALRTAGFDIEHEQDLAERRDDLKWYYPLEGNIWKAQTAWDMLAIWGASWSGMLVTQAIIWIMELLYLLPKGTSGVVKSFALARAGLLKGGRLKLFTPMYLAISRKPVNREFSLRDVLSLVGRPSQDRI